jgi:Uncharacterized conserved protein, contains double-stranded beta-helix domain
MIVYEKDCKTETLPNGATRTIKGYIDDLMLVEMVFPKGAVGAPHSHPHRQLGYVVKGSFEGVVAGEKAVLKAGDVYYTLENQEHGMVALEDGSVLLDVFTPKREDFLK